MKSLKIFAIQSYAPFLRPAFYGYGKRLILPSLWQAAARPVKSRASRRIEKQDDTVLTLESFFFTQSLIQQFDLETWWALLAILTWFLTQLRVVVLSVGNLCIVPTSESQWVETGQIERSNLPIKPRHKSEKSWWHRVKPNGFLRLEL